MSKPDFKGEAQAESRRFPRIPLKMNLRYQTILQAEPFHLYASRSLAEDLGSKGLAMRSQQPLLVDQILSLSLFLPPAGLRKQEAEGDPELLPESKCQKVDVVARVAWCKPAEDSNYRVGIEFLDLSVDDRRRLKSFLVDYKLDDSDSSLFT